MKTILMVVVVLLFAALVVWGVRTGMQNKESVPALEEPDLGDETGEGEKITTPEGLTYRDLRAGTGETAEKGDIATVHYVGALENGKVFDASTARGEPFQFRIGAGEVIKGWDLGVSGMKEGGIRELVIPPNLGYGSEARGPIPAGSTLLFTVELLSVEKGS